MQRWPTAASKHRRTGTSTCGSIPVASISRAAPSFQRQLIRCPNGIEVRKSAKSICLYVQRINYGFAWWPWGGVSAFRHSKWFTRRWTLQELLARRILFFNQFWVIIGFVKLRESDKKRVIPKTSWSGFEGSKI